MVVDIPVAGSVTAAVTVSEQPFPSDMVTVTLGALNPVLFELGVAAVP
jgi:hypothetical protein